MARGPARASISPLQRAPVAGEPRALALARRARRARARLGRGRRAARPASSRSVGPLDVDEQVHAVEQRPAQPAAVAAQVGLAAACSGRSTPANPHGHGLVAATSMNRVGNTQRALAADDRHAAVLERLAQRLERSSAGTPTARRGTARRGGRGSPRPAAAARRRRPARTARSCGAARGTAARAISPPACSPATLWIRVTSIASARVSGGRIDGSRRASIVLPVPGRALEQQVVAAGGGDLQRQQRRVVAADVGEVRARRRGAGCGRARRGQRRRLGAPREHVGRGAQARRRRRPRGRRPAPPRARARAGRSAARSPARRAPSATASAPGESRSSPPSDSSPNTAYAAQRRRAGPGRWRRAPPSASAASKPGPALRRNAGREVRGDPRWRELEARVEDRRADPLARLAHRGVAEADDRERRQPAADVDLDPDLARLDPVDGERGDAGEHRPERTAAIA